MSSPRVTHYECTVYHDSTGSSHTKMYPFTEDHAEEINGVLESDGLSRDKAERLCTKWGIRGSKGSIRYTYRLPIYAKTPEDLK